MVRYCSPLAKIQLKVVKVPDSMDAGEYADELAKELGELQDSELESRDDLEEEDLTPPVPSYLMDEEERKEERLRAFQQVTSDIADTLSQWINSMEVSCDCAYPIKCIVQFSVRFGAPSNVHPLVVLCTVINGSLL